MELDIEGLLKGDVLELQLGYSHPINYEIPKGLEVTVEKNIITLKVLTNNKLVKLQQLLEALENQNHTKVKGVKYTDENHQKSRKNF